MSVRKSIIIYLDVPDHLHQLVLFHLTLLNLPEIDHLWKLQLHEVNEHASRSFNSTDLRIIHPAFLLDHTDFVVYANYCLALGCLLLGAVPEVCDQRANQFGVDLFETFAQKLDKVFHFHLLHLLFLLVLYLFWLLQLFGLLQLQLEPWMMLLLFSHLIIIKMGNCCGTKKPGESELEKRQRQLNSLN
jgi:hypothetical protein